MPHGDPGAEDRLLIQRFLQGEDKAFELLVEKYYRRIDRLAQQVVGNPMTAEDIAQEVFLRAYRALPRFRGESSLYSWLYRITINLSLNHLRRQTALPLPEEEARGAAPSPHDPGALLEERERELLVRRAIASLPPHYRIAVILRDLEGLSYQEIADLLGIPIGTVKSRLNFGKRLLKEKLRPLLEEHP